MKVAVISDPHGNLTALQTVVAQVDAWQPDHVVVAGDVINRGPQPLQCLELVQARMRTHGWRVLKGNHEEYVLSARDDAGRSALERDIMQISHWTLEQLRGNLGFEDWPHSLALTAPDGSALHVWHASPVNNRDCIWPAPRTTDEQLRAKLGDAPPAVLCVGHTHVPLTRECAGTLVANAGSAGLSFDGDPRAAYARLTWHDGRWQAEVVRVPYDTARAEAAYSSSGFLDLPLARLVQHELNFSRPMLARWDHLYVARIRAGELGVAQSVNAMLEY